MVQSDDQEAGLQEGNTPQHQIHYQKMLNKDSVNNEEIIPQQQTQGIFHQKKTTKIQAVQVDEQKEEERQMSRTWLNRSDHQGALEEEC